MINTSNTDVIVRIPVSQATIRFNGVDRKVFNLNGGFCFAEYADGSVFQVTNPLKEWGIAQDNVKAQAAVSGFNVYFEFEPEGKRGNAGGDDEKRSVTDDEFSL